jgi:peptide/nickel transport system ATP-binding protein
MSIIFVTHDLGIVAEIADSVAVMYQGKIVEYGSVWQIFSSPQHPYTKGLLTCRPRPDRRLKYLPTVSDFMEVVTTPSGETTIREKQTEIAQRLQAATESTEVDPIRQFDQQLAGVQPESYQSGAEARLRTFQEISEVDLNQRLTELQQKSPLLSVTDLQVAFPVRGIWGQAKRYVMAVNGVSFELYPGETLGLVGESGCGKTTLARALLRLIEPTQGQIVFDGQDVTALGNRQLRQLRQEMQIIFQNPFGSLDPRMNVGNAVMEPMQIYGRGNRRQHRERAAYLLERVGLSPDYMNRYPHEFSGGQRQRICIARSLALNPKFIICDESVSALDVSVQAQVLNLLKEVQEEFGLTYIFISHDLSVVKFMSDRIMVMNRGKIEEIGPAERIYRDPQQAYTRQLISAIPVGNLEQIRDRQVRRGVSV